ncbi:hypothetical protein E2562_001375 [Oryza meyeriana var. granulata]|uniref:Uncharacterized protein n=1 Tax=Oryza meyeriana var. granulata TaxID=110450 RepID=A0A6G1DCN1_9ORYZ|nr:hypothetical protein E2562_001375 [Oryza meyeriana var. granulata]
MKVSIWAYNGCGSGGSDDSERVPDIWVPYLGLFVLDLESMQIQRAAGDNQTHVWPYEIDLTLLFSSLKQFY